MHVCKLWVQIYIAAYSSCLEELRLGLNVGYPFEALSSLHHLTQSNAC